MTRLSWSQIRLNAAQFASDWETATYERGETQSFYNDFFQIFGVKRRQVASYEQPVSKLGNKRGFIDLFWKGVLLVEQKSKGRDLVKAKEQALDYFPGLKSYELPRYILVCDFQHFELYDLDEDTEVKFKLADLPKYVESFSFILGIQKRTFRDQDPVNIDASELMGELHDALKKSGYIGRDLERLLVRLVFCLFADDTGIFEPRGIFRNLIEERTNADGSDLGRWLTELFEVLNEPEGSRQAFLDPELKEFPYINGDLFAQRLRPAAFSAAMRQLLINACDFSWDAISPAIFGSLFQSVMNAKERRSQGAHYTTEKNILKVIGPLFLDELHAEFNRIVARRDNGRRLALEQFHDRLAQLHFLDPACGCGNFLIIAYRELRELELQVLRALGYGQQRVIDIASLVKLNVDQFYGIEISEFPARIAEIALWMTDHIANNRASLEFGQVFMRIPLRTSPHIYHQDALEVDWNSILCADECHYVLGNPPFIGSKMQTGLQRQQVQRIAQLGGSGGTLDFVSAWFIKAAHYTHLGGAKIGFVSTNSITQGEQVAQLWPILFDRYQLEIAFAHRTFAWGSDARGKAHVHVVIIGLTTKQQEPSTKRLFTYPLPNADPIESPHMKISPYLIDAQRLSNPHLVVREVPKPINGAPKLVIGSKPIDNGHFIFKAHERAVFLQQEPAARDYLHPYVGAEEMINGGERWILALQHIEPNKLREMPLVMERVKLVKQFRANSPSKQTQVIPPTHFHVTVIPKQGFLAIPEVSSERREYVPIAYFNPPVIPSNLVRVLVNADHWHFGILTSKMNMVWLSEIGGRLKSDYRYSIDIVYNNFPWPNADEKQRDHIRKLAQKVLTIREDFPAATLADLYDPDAMPPALRKAHTTLDLAVDNLYRPTPFQDNNDRLEYLLRMYEQLTMPLLTQPLKKVKRKPSKK